MAGEEQAWELLAGLDPEEVRSRARVDFDGSAGRYILKSLGQPVYISLPKREISSETAPGRYLIGKLGYFSKLSILWYLLEAKELSPSGHLVKPSELPGGELTAFQRPPSSRLNWTIPDLVNGNFSRSSKVMFVFSFTPIFPNLSNLMTALESAPTAT